MEWVARSLPDRLMLELELWMKEGSDYISEEYNLLLAELMNYDMICMK